MKNRALGELIKSQNPIRKGKWGYARTVNTGRALLMIIIAITPRPPFYFPALFWVHENSNTLRVCFYFCLFVFLFYIYIFYPVSNTSLKSTLLIWKNNPLLFNTFWFNVDITNCLYSKCLLYFSKNILIFSSAWKFQLGKQTIKNLFLFQKVLTQDDIKFRWRKF